MSEPLLCVTVAAPTTAELRAKRDAVGVADVIELRLDVVRQPDVSGALAGRTRPVVVTCRPTWEGGSFRGSEEERKRILSDALALGAEYVDVERRASFASELLTRVGGRRIVLSTHDFDGVPGDVVAQTESMLGTNAELVKVVVKANRLADCLAVVHLCGRFESSGRLTAFAMGERGVATRVLAGRIGSGWMYAGTLRDIGQLTADELLANYRFRSISRSTRIFGIVAGSVAHSISPAMHNAAFKASGIDAVYVPFAAVDADDFVAFGRGIGIGGASVTIPHKVTMFDRVDEADETARRIGAINTVRVVDGRWHGRNTDVVGFLAPLQPEGRRSPGRDGGAAAGTEVPREGRRSTGWDGGAAAGTEVRREGRRSPRWDGGAVRRLEVGSRAAVLGAGGAARAVTVALASIGCSVTVYARNLERAAALADRHNVTIAPWPPRPGSWDLLVNCTPVGMYPNVDDTPVPASQLTGRCVYDLIYNPLPTRLLREAAAAGCDTIDGLEMLVAQAHEQFLWWTGTAPPPGTMRAAALSRLSEFVRDENHVV